MTPVLGICNPFIDRSVRVKDAFFEESGLTKGQTTSVEDKSDVERTWQYISAEEKDRWTLGGSGINVMKTLGRLGLSCRVVGKIGCDQRGRDIEKRLVDMGIAPMFSRGKAETGIVNCFITDDSQRTMHAYLGAALELSENDIVKELFVGANHVHLEGYLVYYGQTLEKSVSYAQQARATTSLDLASQNVVEQFKPKFQQNLPKIDYVFGNVEEMEAYTGRKEFKDAIDCFSSKQTIIATEGKKGCWVKNKGESDAVHYDALEVSDVVDTTGAGGLFAAGFLYAALKGNQISQCVKKANLAASFVIREIGADMPDKKWTELAHLISN